MKYYLLTMVFFLCIGCNDNKQCLNTNYENFIRIIFSENNKNKKQYAIRQLAENFHIDGFSVPRIYKEAIELNDEKTLKVLCERLSKKGVPKSFFLKMKHYTWFNKLDFLKSEFNEELRTEVITLMKEDLKFNDNYHSWRNGFLEYSEGDLVFQAGEILRKYLEIVKNHGIPSENEIGYYFNGNVFVDTPIEIILIHLYQRGDRIHFNELESLKCTHKISVNLFNTLKNIRGFGDNVGYEEEMKLRYNMYK